MGPSTTWKQPRPTKNGKGSWKVDPAFFLLRRDTQQAAGVFVAGGVESVLGRAIVAVRTGGHAGQGGDLAPPERRPCRAVFFTHRVEEFLAVQPAIFADRVFDQRVEDAIHRMPLLAVDLDRG